MTDAEKMTEVFMRLMYPSFEFQEALRIANRNSRGPVWAIGGCVYCPLAQGLYGVRALPADFDFIAQELLPYDDIWAPAGWRKERNSFGGPKLVSEFRSVDLVPLADCRSIVRRGLEPDIRNYLTGTPLTVQSIAFDATWSRVFGDIGISAIRSRTVAVHDAAQALHYAGLKGEPVADMVREKAARLRFTPILPLP